MRKLLYVALVACGTSAAAEPTTPLPLAAPQSQGISPARLERATAVLQAAVDQGQYAGAVMLVARRGQIVQWQALGKAENLQIDE